MLVEMDGKQEYSCVYQSGERAKAAAQRFAAVRDRELASGKAERAFEHICGQMNLIQTGVSLLDKRQRKLWRKLKEAIPEIGEEGAEE